MSASADNSYGRILKSSALLGGSSAINVGLGVVRTKVLALQLGPEFFGVMGLYTSITSLIGGVTSLGIGQSAVRDVAAAAGTGDGLRVGRTIRVLRRTVWVTGLIGLVVTLALASPASWWTFGNSDHVWALAALSVTVLISEIQAGQMALLQGLRRIWDVSAINVIGGVWSTLLAIPILLYLREKGIAPFLIAVATGQMVASWWYARRVGVELVNVAWRETWSEARGMMTLGFALMVSGLSVTAAAYLIRLIIQRYVGEVGVGLYQSAFVISSIYVSFVLQAMGGDYYPRLAGTGDDTEKRNRLVNEQAEMAVLLAIPGLVAALIFSDVLVWVLYSDRFAGATTVLRWHVLGLLGRIISWPLGFILLARGDKNTFLWTEVVSNSLHVGLVWAGVAVWGISGAGAAFAALYVFYILLISWVVKRYHGHAWRQNTRNLVLLGALAVGGAFGTTYINSTGWRIASGTIILAITVCLCMRGLRERLGRERIARARQAILKWLGMHEGEIQ